MLAIPRAMNVFESIALILTLAATGAYVNHRILKLPSTIGMMVFALVISLIAMGLNRLGVIDLSPASYFVSQINFSDILLHGLLSFLLFAGAMHINLADLKQRHKTIVAILATLSVGVAAFITGSLVWFASGWIGLQLPFLQAMLFGTLIAPTDPVAVLGVLQHTKLSKNLRVKIGCESLLNDGVGVVLFLLALGLATHPEINLSTTDVIYLLAWQGGASIVLGLALGVITHYLLDGIDDYKIEVLLTLALVMGGYSLAEGFHVSAPITMVIAGLVIGNRGQLFGIAERTRHHVDLFWELIDDILNTILFMLIGLQLIVIPFTSQYLEIGLVGIVATLMGRFISVAAPVSVMRLAYRFDRGTIRLMTWGGLRGGISIALALSLPLNEFRDIILGMTYIVVLFSVLFQGTTFRHLAQVFAKK